MKEPSEAAKREMIDIAARILVKARGCADDNSAMGTAGFPCPFCHWDESAADESGCFYWAGTIIDALAREWLK